MFPRLFRRRLLEEEGDEEELDAAPTEAEAKQEGVQEATTRREQESRRNCALRRDRWCGRGYQGAAGLS